MYPILKKPRKLKLEPNIAIMYLEKNNDIVALGINHTAYDILSLCNGENSIGDIVKTMKFKYNEPEKKVFDFVNDFINDSIKFKTIEIKDRKCNYPIKLIGSSEYWVPDLVIIELTYNCPLSCKHCYLEAGENRAEYQMEFVKLKNICKYLIDNKVDKVQLTGGEPLIYPGIEYIIKYLHKAGVYISITTSGFYCKESIYEVLKLLENNKGKIQVSLDGLEETHNRIRQNKNSFSNAIEFIKKIISMGIQVDVATTLFEQSFEEVDALCAYLKELGVNRYRIGLIFEKGRAYNNNISLTTEFINKFHELIFNLKQKYNSESFIIVSEEETGQKLKNQKVVHCGAGYKTLRISPNYNVYPCSMIDYPIDNLMSISFTDFIKKYSTYFYEIDCPKEEYCGDCKYKVICNNCIAQGLINSKKNKACKWYNYYGDKIAGVDLL